MADKHESRREKGSKLSPVMSYYADAFDRIDREERIRSGFSDFPRQTSGNLVTDFLMGGGFVPGWFSISGGEGSGKTTTALECLGASVQQPCDIRRLFDAENALDADYSRRVWDVKDVRDVIGLQDEKTGQWIKYPHVRYSDTDVAEKVFRIMRRTLAALPGKTYLPEEKQWFYVFQSNDKEQVAAMHKMRLEPDSKLSKRFNALYCPTDTVGLQGFFVLDSIPMLVTEDMHENPEEEGNAMALMARVFSKLVPTVRGQFRSKAVNLLVVNQLRDKPGVMFGSPEYEPGGNAIKFASDCRLQQRSVMAPKDYGFERDKTRYQLGSEQSIDDPNGTDYYAYKNIVNTKNKTGIPYLKSQLRIWVQDAYGNARGVCPVYDTYRFLDDIGLIDGSVRRGFQINYFEELAGIRFNWTDFKKIILAEDDGDKGYLYDKLKRIGARGPIKLREECFRLLRKKTAYELYAKSLLKRTGKSPDKPDDDTEDTD